MKTELSKIAQDLEQCRIDETEAQDLLLGLLGVSKSVFVVLFVDTKAKQIIQLIKGFIILRNK